MRAITLALLALPLASQTFDAAYFATTDPKTIMDTAADKARIKEALDSRLQAEYGRAYLAAGLRKKAEDSFSAAIIQDPKDSETRQLIALAWFQNGYKVEGLAALEPLRKPDLKYVSGYALAAVDQLKYGTPQDADALMEVGSSKDKRSWRDFFKFAKACVEAGQLDLAVKWFQRDARETDARSTLLKEAMALLDAGHVKEAEGLMEALDPYDKRNRDTYKDFGDYCFDVRQSSTGPKWLKLGGAEQDTTDDAIRLGITKLDEGHPEEAKPAFEIALKDSPDNAQVFRRIAAAWLGHGRATEAAPLLDRFKALTTKEDGDCFDPAQDLLAMGFSQDADTLMERYASRKKREWGDFLHFADHCIQADQAALATKWLKRGAAKKDAKENLTKGAIDLLDRHYAAEASAVMEAAYALDEQDWEDCVEFGRAAIRNHDMSLAATYFARAIERDPGTGRLHAMSAAELNAISGPPTTPGSGAPTFHVVGGSGRPERKSTSSRMWNEIALAYADKGVGIRNHFWLQ